jgi:hypothetical protein
MNQKNDDRVRLICEIVELYWESKCITCYDFFDHFPVLCRTAGLTSGEELRELIIRGIY